MPLSIDRIFAYSLREDQHPVIGGRVVVPFRRRLQTAYVISMNSNYRGKTLHVRKVIDKRPLFPPNLLACLKWASYYYKHPLGEVLKTAHPDLAHIEQRMRYRLSKEGRKLFKLHEQGRFTEEGSIIFKAFSKIDSSYLAGTLIQRGLSRKLIDKALKEGVLEEFSRVGKKGTEGLSKAITQVAEPDEKQMAWLERGSKRIRVFEQLCDVKLPVTLKEIRAEWKNVSGILKDLEAAELIKIEKITPGSQFDLSVSVEKFVPELTDEQKHIHHRLQTGLDSFNTYLLHGITGSGKTEIYIRLISNLLARGRTAIVLVPEISLTPQLVATFQSRLEQPVSVFHSKLTSRERVVEWRRLQSGKSQLVIGARSAVFAPLENLGVIIVDEEHDNSFKQENGFRYNGRDLAILRAQKENIPIILGSATPSFESYHNARQGKYEKLTLSSRPTPRPLPEVEIIDLKKYHARDGISFPLKKAITENLEAGQQTLLFVARRGFSGKLQCKDCGEPAVCPHCSVTLTHHLRKNRTICHYCGYSTGVPKKCSICGGELTASRWGTEKVLASLSELFPEAVIERLDRDTSRFDGLQKVINSMRKGKIDILLGTQMVTKGHDFPEVTLVGVLNADHSLFFPDFRAAERTFQLLVQVSGRAGRGKKPGKVIVQTRKPDSYTIVSASDQNYQKFYEQEFVFRKELNYPPCGHLVLIRIKSTDALQVEDEAGKLALYLKKNKTGDIQVLGPVPSPIEKIKKKIRWQILLKSVSRKNLQIFIDKVRKDIFKMVSETVIDVDPVNML